MEEIIKKEYLSKDGLYFLDKDKCEKHEKAVNDFKELIENKIGSFEKNELSIGKGVTTVTNLPYKAPWLSPYGACFIMITDLRRNNEGKVEFQLGNESAEPYEKGTIWVKANAFYPEWPD